MKLTQLTTMLTVILMATLASAQTDTTFTYGRTAEFRESIKLAPETLRQRQAASQSAEQKIGSQIERRED